MANTRQELKRAFELIQKDQLDEAILIIRPITISEPDNADAWWLMANAASEPRDARRALVNVLKINPTYPKARALLDQLNELHPPRDEELMMMMEIAEPEDPGFPVAQPATTTASKNDLSAMFADEGRIRDDELDSIDDLFADRTINTDSFEPVVTTNEDDWGDEADPFADVLERDNRRGGSRTLRLVGVLVALLLVILAAGLLLVAFMGGDDEDGTPAAADPGTLVAVAPSDINADNQANLDAILTTTQNQARIGLGVGADANAVYAQTPDGAYALMVQVCAPPSPRIAELVQNAIDLVAQNISAVQEDVQAIGVSVDDCASNDTLYRVFAPIEAVNTYLQNRGQAGAFTEFRNSWVTVG